MPTGGAGEAPTSRYAVGSGAPNGHGFGCLTQPQGSAQQAGSSGFPFEVFEGFIKGDGKKMNFLGPGSSVFAFPKGLVGPSTEDAPSGI